MGGNFILLDRKTADANGENCVDQTQAHITSARELLTLRSIGNYPFAELKDIFAAGGFRVRYLDQDVETTDNPKYGTVVLEKRV